MWLAILENMAIKLSKLKSNWTVLSISRLFGKHASLSWKECINSFKEQVLISEGCTMLVKQFIPFIYLTFISIQAGGGYIVVMC